jgi:cell wall-associated NlpC family hydrolase
MVRCLVVFMAAASLLAAENGRGVVLRPVVNLYENPSADSEVASQAIHGWPVEILERQGDWARVRTEDEYTGWMEKGAWREGVYAVAGGAETRAAEVATMFAHIYREASVTKHAPVVTLPFESRLEVFPALANRAEWLRARLADGTEGWVQAGDLAFAPARLTIPEMIAFSKRFLGLPYTWGGSSSYGYDCSGLSQMLNRRRGVMLPRDAQPQAESSAVTAVERTELQPGDLLYFGSSEKKITHTGIYLGEGQFINATTHEAPVVRIDNLSDPHWDKLLVACRRAKS